MKVRLLSLAILSVFLSISIQAQEKKLSRKELREIEKEKQKEMELILAAELEAAFENKTWVIEAHTLSNKYGASTPVNPTLNFVAIEGEEAFIQLGSDSGLGANGVGGVSVKARISKYELIKNEKKSTFYIHILVNSAIGTYDIRLDCNSSGQMATTSVQGNSSNRINYTGQIVPLSKSTVYKGTPLF